MDLDLDTIEAQFCNVPTRRGTPEANVIRELIALARRTETAEVEAAKMREHAQDNSYAFGAVLQRAEAAEQERDRLTDENRTIRDALVGITTMKYRRNAWTLVREIAREALAKIDDHEEVET